jgi:small subunit ribosomal protein S2
MRGKRGLFDWVWSLARVSLVILLLWIWLRYQEEQEQSPAQPIELKDEELPQKPLTEKPATPARPAEARKSPAKPDDLTRIKGIGPKTSGALKEAGISSYKKLAETSIQDIKELLEKANYRLLDPSTWTEQARLAANGQWEELEKLQESMKTNR